jgi:nucleolar protein 9
MLVSVFLAIACLNAHRDVVNKPGKPLPPSDYVSAMIRDSVSSHLIEAALDRASDTALAIFWDTYFKTRLDRLSQHPVGNFVLAKAFARADSDQLGDVFEEIPGQKWRDLIGEYLRSSSCSMI